MDIKTISLFLGEIGAVLAALTPVILWIKKIIEAQKCQLRSKMLDTYYHNRESKTIRQYEYENFVFLYEAYKALKGNSFIDKIYDEIKSWEIIP